ELPKGKRRDNLIAGREQAFISRELARLHRDVPVALDWARARVGRPNGADARAVSELCNEFGFRGLAEKLAKLSSSSETSAAGATAAAPAATASKTEYQLVDTPQKLAAFIEQLRAQK